MHHNATLLENQVIDFSLLKYAYAISGGIGSGKSTTCLILQSLGYKVIDADKIAHQVLEEKTQELVREFGEIILEDGKLSRQKLGKIVFGDAEKLKRLNQILSKAIQEKLYQTCMEKEKGQKIYFVELALLFEQREIYSFAHTLLVACSREKQIWRVMQRNRLTKEEVELRIQAQMPLEEKIKMADHIIWNEEGEQELKEEILRLLNLLKQ
ncbi:dephospho-CoA kinase [Helicobacter kayseriensis]|uniref:dephospho-CoA kinase n=1 Tax=Helicobacter kayseriensis TaxID=2905877 RepID=UPI001E2AD29E|nr:dephospho-CoA kinase [Helicobacter kayseriensis]MCE3046752.1 dephospho-CoA kinase [Helicobacter kayseriensis]MCE3047946.1 dephospho-CoA kinase [Helicobacter kayseriensis]